MGNFDWLSGPVEKGREQKDVERLTYAVRRTTQPFQGRDLVEWMSLNLEWDIVTRLAEISSSREEHAVVSQIALVCVGPRRIKTWRQSWRVLSNSGVTFEFLLIVEERAPKILHVRMTKHAAMAFPPIEPEHTQPVRDQIVSELFKATADVAGLEFRGRLYDFRPHPLWSPLTPMRRRLARPMIRIGTMQVALEGRAERTGPVFLRGVRVVPLALLHDSREVVRQGTVPQ